MEARRTRDRPSLPSQVDPTLGVLWKYLRSWNLYWAPEEPFSWFQRHPSPWQFVLPEGDAKRVRKTFSQHWGFSCLWIAGLHRLGRLNNSVDKQRSEQKLSWRVQDPTTAEILPRTRKRYSPVNTCNSFWNYRHWVRSRSYFKTILQSVQSDDSFRVLRSKQNARSILLCNKNRSPSIFSICCRNLWRSEWSLWPGKRRISPILFERQRKCKKSFFQKIIQKIKSQF